VSLCSFIGSFGPRSPSCQGCSALNKPILRPGKCRSRPQKAHDQLGVRLRPSSPNGLLGDGERQQRKLSTERARHVTWCCGRPEVGLGSKERVKSSFFEPDGGRPVGSDPPLGRAPFLSTAGSHGAVLPCRWGRVALSRAVLRVRGASVISSLSQLASTARGSRTQEVSDTLVIGSERRARAHDSGACRIHGRVCSHARET